MLVGLGHLGMELVGGQFLDMGLDRGQVVLEERLAHEGLVQERSR